MASAAEEKQRVRELIWRLLEEKGIARPPLPLRGRIPNFVGAEQAALRLASTEEFMKAKVIKVNPDSPQRPVREIALRQGKVVLVPTPRLRGEFYLLDPARLKGMERYASTIAGFTRLGRRIRLEEAPRVDLVVAGSVAVTPHGDRVGKGEGYSELEYAMLRELGKVDEGTPVATTVHEVQVVDSIPSEPFDVPVDIIATPMRLIYVSPRRPKPRGLLLEYLSREKVLSTPYLLEHLRRTGRWR